MPQAKHQSQPWLPWLLLLLLCCCVCLQGMAGNIIHAIATTNAIVGGIIVSEALKVLAGEE